MKILLSLLIFFFSLSAESNVREKESNISVIDSVVTAIILDNLIDVGREYSDSLAIDLAMLGFEKENYLKVIIGNLATEKSFRVVRNYNQGSSFQGLVLTIDQFNVHVEYSKPFEKSLLGESYVGREITTEMRGQLYLKRSALILAAIDENIKLSDEVPSAEITRIENTNYSFSQGERKDYSFWDKVFEPVMVVSAVAIIVYLFYTQRT